MTEPAGKRNLLPEFLTRKSFMNLHGIGRYEFIVRNDVASMIQSQPSVQRNTVGVLCGSFTAAIFVSVNSGTAMGMKAPNADYIVIAMRWSG